MLHFCLPMGGSNLLSMSNRYAASIFVAKAMGPVALAHYTIGTYVEPIIITLRNSLSDALLPAIVNRGSRSQAEAVTLWQRGTVIAAVLLLPIGCLIERYADTLITTVFSSTYQAAVPVMRIFLIVLIRECFDFPMALKAISKTRYFLYGDVAAIVVNLALLVALVPTLGLGRCHDRVRDIDLVARLLSRLVHDPVLPHTGTHIHTLGGNVEGGACRRVAARSDVRNLFDRPLQIVRGWSSVQCCICLPMLYCYISSMCARRIPCSNAFRERLADSYMPTLRT